MKKRLLFLYSHPIQYFAPLSRALAQSDEFEVLVCYCSDHGVKAYKDEEFNQTVQWDIPLLEGYESIFLKNYARNPGLSKGFRGLVNWGILKVLRQQPKSYVIVHGWGYLTTVLTLLVARAYGHTVCLRGESPLSHEAQYSSKQAKRRKRFFQHFLFPRIDKFLYIGSQNKAFYQKFGVKEEQLIFAPYSIDNERFGKAYESYRNEKESLRQELNLPLDKRILLFSGKYIDKKRPMDLLRAFAQLKNEAAHLIFVGDGPLRQEMEAFIAMENLSNITLTGFVNQSIIPKYYAIADLFVMCSQEGETWGLSTNEAMNFALPLVLSDLTGSSSDLVVEGKNGYVFPTGKVEALREKLELMLSFSDEKLLEMGAFSKQLIPKYSYDTIVKE
ncbi:MAG: glycosyltransferase family 4 protein, partial [Bacteroidota bacterium]